MTSEASTLGEVFDIPEVVSASDYVLQLHSGVEHAERTVGEYVVTESLAAAFDRALDLVGAAVQQGTSKGVFVHGSFGSGKSHFMAVLDLILRGSAAARALPALQPAVAKHRSTLDKNYLTVEYHLMQARSLEDALFRGYLDTVRRTHPDAVLPQLHNTDPLLANARQMLDSLGAETFLAQLNGASGAAGATPGEGWGNLAGQWTEASVRAALDAPYGDSERDRLVTDLTGTLFPAYDQVGQWLDVPTGLQAMSAHAKSLGYDAIVLFLDELVLWLASRLADRDFVSTEGAKVASLVEMGNTTRELPIISFVARQRDLQDFLGEGVDALIGAERMAVGETFRWWEGRFDRIELAAADLPAIAHKRLLQPRDETAAGQVATAVKALKASNAWDALMEAEGSHGETEFAEVYPFSPALVDALVALSSLLQRERTALKVMAQLLVAGRETLTINDIIPVGSLYDVVVDSGDDPLTEEMRRLFLLARGVYRERLRPALLSQHGITEEDAATLPYDSPFSRDDRLAKTLIIASLVPSAAPLRNLTASRLAALNHGSVLVRIPGQEVASVLGKVRGWAETVAEIQVGDGPDPTVRLEMSGVDYGAILERVANEDSEGARRTLLRKMLFESLGITEDASLFDVRTFPLVWRGSKREVDIVFGNIRDATEVPDAAFQADGEKWRVVLDYPFDSQGYTPADDLSRVERIRGIMQTRTVAWVPGFFTAERQEDLGRLVRLEYLLRGDGAHFDEHAAHLPVNQRVQARQQLENMRGNLRNRVNELLKQAYGTAKREAADIDTIGQGESDILVSLDADFTPLAPVGATLAAALEGLADQMLSSQYPDHPRFDTGGREVSRAAMNVTLDHVRQAVERGGRVEPVESSKRANLRTVAVPLGLGVVGENHYVFDAANFKWRNEFTRRAADEGVADEVPVERIRQWLAPYGLSKPLQDLLILSWALLDDKEFARHGAAVPVSNLDEVRDDMVLRAPELPDDDAWAVARTRAATLFGVSLGEVKSVANLRRLYDGVQSKASTMRDDARRLLRALQQHADTLALKDAPAPPRLTDAESGVELLNRLNEAQSPLALVHTLAQFALPDQPQPLAHSLATSADVSTALEQASWQLLDQVASAAGNDDDARSALEPLWAAARQSEAHASLPKALRLAGDAGGAYVRDMLQRRPQPTPGPGPSPDPGPTPVVPVPDPVVPAEPSDMAGRLDGISLGDAAAVDEHLNKLRTEVMAAKEKAAENATLTITWQIT